MDQQPIPSNVMAELYHQKWVIMFETKPLSDRFEQIMLTAEQARAIANILFAQMSASKTVPGAFVIPTNDDFAATLPNIPFSYSEDKVKEEIAKE